MISGVADMPQGARKILNRLSYPSQSFTVLLTDVSIVSTHVAHDRMYIFAASSNIQIIRTLIRWDLEQVKNSISSTRDACFYSLIVFPKRKTLCILATAQNYEGGGPSYALSQNVHIA